MVFQVQIKSGYKWIRLTVERTYLDERIERFKVIGKDRTVELESNRPFFRNRGLKHRKPDWKLIDGKAMFGSSFDSVIEEILKQVDK